MSNGSTACERAKIYFEIALGKDWSKECWTSSTHQDYTATVRLYNKYHNGRTYEQFLKQVLGGQR